MIFYYIICKIQIEKINHLSIEYIYKNPKHLSVTKKLNILRVIVVNLHFYII